MRTEKTLANRQTRARKPRPLNLRKVYLAARRITKTIEAVDWRCLKCDGPVTKTENEWTSEEKRRILRAIQEIASEVKRVRVS